MELISFKLQRQSLASSTWLSFFSVILVGFLILFSSCSEEAPIQKINLYEVNASSQLIMRSEPSKSGQKIVSIPDKTKIEVKDVENGWAHIKWDDYEGYVNADYIIPLMTEPASQSVQTEPSSQVGSSRDINELGSKYLPFVVLILFIAAVICLARNENSMIPWWLMVIVSVGEILFLKSSPSGFYYWFLEPSEVGWIWTIVNYAIMLGLVVSQGIMVVIWVSNTSSGWFTNLLTWGISFVAGLVVYLVLLTYDKLEFIHVIMGLVVVLCLIGLVYYSNRSWSEVWYISIIDMIIVSSYLCLIISLVSHIIIGLVGLITVAIFMTKGGGGNSLWFYGEDEYGNKIRLKRSNTPNIAHDTYGTMYEFYSDGKWRKC